MSKLKKLKFHQAAKLIEDNYVVRRSRWPKENFVYLHKHILCDQDGKEFRASFSDIVNTDWEVAKDKERPCMGFLEAYQAVLSGQEVARLNWKPGRSWSWMPDHGHHERHNKTQDRPFAGLTLCGKDLCANDWRVVN